MSRHAEEAHTEDRLNYAEMESVDPGLKFKTISGLMVETTGNSDYVDATDVHVHEVVILEGVGEGNKYLYNLDTGELLED